MLGTRSAAATQIDVSLPQVVNAAGAAFFVGLGAFALAVGRRSSRARLLALASFALGVPLVVFNLVVFDRTTVIAQTIAESIAAFLVVPLALHLVAGVPRRTMRRFALGAAAIVGGLAMSAVRSFRDPGPFRSIVPTVDDPTILAWNLLAFNALGGALVLVVLAAALRSRETAPEERGPRRALALLALAMGAFPIFYLAPLYLAQAQLAPAWIGMVVASFAWVGAGPRHDPAPALATALVLQACALAGLLFWGPIARATGNPGFVDYGLPGIIRTVGAFLLLLAILRHDLLAVPLPHVTVRRGPLAATALAALLIVAQVAQNFLSAEYGLLIGGVVAGALLVAARPIERALEGRRASAAQPSAPDQAARERSFQAPARRFLRDGTLTPDEERELVILAEHLGIPASRAYALRDEVERGPPP